MIMNPYETYYSYNISEMMSIYPEENLEVDDTLTIQGINPTLSKLKLKY